MAPLSRFILASRAGFNSDFCNKIGQMLLRTLWLSLDPYMRGRRRNTGAGSAKWTIAGSSKRQPEVQALQRLRGVAASIVAFYVAGNRSSPCRGLSSIRPSICTENPIPKKMDHREIAVRVPVMYKVQLLFASEPREPLKPRSLHVVFLVKNDVRVKRRRTRDYHHHKKV
jgi:hypothetical protein